MRHLATQMERRNIYLEESEVVVLLSFEEKA